MPAIEAIYQGGVFKPLNEIDLPENQRVLVSPQPTADPIAIAWFEEMKEFHERMIAERGYLPDSTPDIAEDRLRDD